MNTSYIVLVTKIKKLSNNGYKYIIIKNGLLKY